MEDFKKRLIEEAGQLSDKIGKLRLFFDSDKWLEIDPVQASLLSIQYAAMQTYERCLLERIARL